MRKLRERMRPTLSIAAASMAERKNTTSARPVPKSWAIRRNFFDQRPSLMDSFFGNSGFFDSMPSLMGRMLESPFDDFFDTMPAIGAGSGAGGSGGEERGPDE